jgi:hypothetical protein
MLINGQNKLFSKAPQKNITGNLQIPPGTGTVRKLPKNSNTYRYSTGIVMVRGTVGTSTNHYKGL